MVNAKLRLLALALVGLATTACASMSEFDAAPPAGTFSAAFALPPPGARWVLQETSFNETTDKTATQTVTWTVLDAGTRRGKPVYRLTDGSHVHVYDGATYGTLALVDRDGAELITYDPHEGQFASRLWVGRSWTARSDWTSHVHRRSLAGIVVVWKVAALEDVDVPAGRFKAFRVEAWLDDRDPVRKRIYWYAPDLKLVVKQQLEGALGGEDRIRLTTELVAFKADGPPADDAVRGKAFTALEEFEPLAPDAATVFADAVRDLNTPIATIALLAKLRGLGEDTLPVLIELARSDASPRIRSAAVDAIKVLSVEDASAAVRGDAERALQQFPRR